MPNIPEDIFADGLDEELLNNPDMDMNNYSIFEIWDMSFLHVME